MMMKNKIMFTVWLTLLNVLFISQMTFAATQKLTAEEIKLKQDKLKYQAYIPEKYVLFEAIEGDLNKDGLKDVALMVKATDPKQWIDHEYRGRLDRNRRGIIVLVSEKGKYKPIVRNLSSFSSENEEGGVYFAPELWVSIEKGLLNVHYGHGRYGYWNYTFRLQQNDLRLIGYDDASHHGPYVKSETSINFLTQKQLIRQNTNEDMEAEPTFKETWSKVNFEPLYLSEIKDFDELSF